MNSNEIDFTFEHIVFLSNRDLWNLLLETDNVTILKACIGADNFVLVRVRSVFSKTACKYFNDDLIRFCTASEQEIYTAQTRIVNIFRRLNRRGMIKDWNSLYAA